jgi:hypothetical protein
MPQLSCLLSVSGRLNELGFIWKRSIWDAISFHQQKTAGARFRYAAATDLWRSIQRPAVATRYFAPQALPTAVRNMLERY